MKNHPIYIIGKGNLGWHLAQLFEFNQIEIKGWLSSRESLERFELTNEAILFLTVSDSVIEKIVCELLNNNNRLIIVYCSGSIDIVSKYPENVICWYPLYSFTKGIPVDWNKVPVFTEIGDSLIKQTIENINIQLNIKSVEISAEIRKRLHLSAVFINNFTTACAVAANTVLNDSILFTYLLPILNQTIEKITNYSGDELVNIQTGPAKRRDEIVIEEHLALLKSLASERQLYDAVSKYIKQKTK
jgi:predicted short-subunit dehydrogenase-like oxidoreductase (DUF2520 family)